MNKGLFLLGGLAVGFWLGKKYNTPSVTTPSVPAGTPILMQSCTKVEPSSTPLAQTVAAMGAVKVVTAW